MFERVFKNWKTSLFGVAILIACFVLVWFEKTSLKEVGYFIPVAMGCFYLKDKSVKIPK